MRPGDLVLPRPWPRTTAPPAAKKAHVVARFTETGDNGAGIVWTACGRRFQSHELERLRPDTKRDVCGGCGARWDEVDPD